MAGGAAGGAGIAASARWSLQRHQARAAEAPADAAQTASASPMPAYGVRTAAAAVRPPPSTLQRRAEPRSFLSRRKYRVRSSTVRSSPGRVAQPAAEVSPRLAFLLALISSSR